MRIQLVCWNLGKISLVLGAALLLPIIWSVFEQESILSLLYTLFIAVAVGCILMFISKNAREQTLRHREGYALVSLGWLLASLIGMLPYLFSGVIPDVSAAFFESVSGFTTTGATVIDNVEIQPKGILLWRAMTHWVGGMGIVVLLVAIAGHSKGISNLYNAETPGSSHTDRLTPKISETSLIVWSTYFVMTIVLILLLKVEGMTLFDSICHSFSTVATGGFSTKADSIAAYPDPIIQWTLIIFMFLSGSNIAYLYFLFVKRKVLYLRNEEFRVYTLVVVIATLVIAVLLLSVNDASVEKNLRDACFQVVSIVTTTGYASADYTLWPHLAQVVILTMFFVGGCFGSTAGSIKIPRWCIAIKSFYVYLQASVHPRSVNTIRLNNRVVPSQSASSTMNFIVMYIAAIFIGATLICVSGVSFYDSLVTALSCIANAGPAFGEIGAFGSYSVIPGFGQVVLSILMLIGRLEIYTVLILFLPSVWKK